MTAQPATDRDEGPLRGLATGLRPHVGEDAARDLALLAVARLLRPDEALYEQGDDRAPDLHVVLGGLLLVQRRRPSGTEHLLALLGPGDLAGEVGALDPGPRSTRVVALVASRVATVPRADLATWLARHPDATGWLLGALARRVRRAERDLADLSGLDSAARVAKVLVDLADHGRDDDGGGVLIDRTLTQAHLARLSGCTRETTNRALRAFSDGGLVLLAGRRLVVTDVEGLRRAVDRTATSSRRPRRRIS